MPLDNDALGLSVAPLLIGTSRSETPDQIVRGWLRGGGAPAACSTSARCLLLAVSDRIAAWPLRVGTTRFSYCWFARRLQIVIDATTMSTATTAIDTTISDCARSPESGVIGFVADNIIS
jgi:hypothetical protein